MSDSSLTIDTLNKQYRKNIALLILYQIF